MLSRFFRVSRACRLRGLLLCGAALAWTSGHAQTLWQAQKDDRTILLVPTIHVAAPGDLTLSPAFKEALRPARSAFFELKSASFTRKDLVTLPAHEDLLQRLSPPARVFLRECFASLPLNPLLAQRVHPWAASVDCERALLQRHGIGSAHGMEAVLRSHLESELGLSIEGLETLDEQFEMLASLPQDLFLESLEAAAANPQVSLDRKQRHRRLLAALLEGDEARLDGLTRAIFYEKEDEHHRLFARRVLEDRNRRYAQIIQAGGHDTPALFAVGAFHFAGPQGLLDLLRCAGWEVRLLHPVRHDAVSG